MMRATCHCGAVELDVELSRGLETARRCNCSFCRRRGAAMVSASLDRLRVVRGADKLTLYRWNTEVAEHYFCSVCGIYTHHRRRSNPNEYGVNMGILEGVDPSEYEPIAWSDGVNHPADRRS
jgi:hypothetical protein